MFNDCIFTEDELGFTSITLKRELCQTGMGNMGKMRNIIFFLTHKLKDIIVAIVIDLHPKRSSKAFLFKKVNKMALFIDGFLFFFYSYDFFYMW